ncbi:hypothetical protein GGI25_002303 [Coemansia spiralis]|uniref:Uncharacterized protein n=2 Tax=Coemansia TaxID=4863 RepID=A0A9W8GAY3_9FUNG|nr:hypothetical protein EDC05_001128 [Coemansia umbellata]KAJ2625691.1 hypothetical protein GGI26_000491 [Coemansia sp. RSA 1358]KAJ2678509.1 hypothetical protein GGI25_002303 [Coemansia spiralis]
MKHLVLAPSLKFVRVDLCQSSCSFLYSIASQTVLEELVITIPNGITLEFHNFKITDNVKSIFVKHSDSEMGIINGMEFANDILGLSDVAMSATANYSNHMRSSDIEKVKWNSVDVLKIHTSIKLSSLSMIIQQIPKLSRLEACYLTLDIDVTDTSIASALQHALSRLPAPFSSNIKSLLLGFVADNVPDKVYSQIDSALRSNIESLITLDFVKR